MRVLRKERYIMKKTIFKQVAAATLSLTLAFSLVGCGSTKEATAGTEATDEPATEAPATENATIKVGASITPHSEILEQAKPILAEKGITLEIVPLEDYVTPNTGVIEGSLDANYCEHLPYLEQFNEENKSDLISIGAIHYEPFGVYAGKTKSLADLPDGAVVAVPNDVTNEARALLLLAQEGLLKLKDDAGINATAADIVENPKKIEFKELAPEQLAASLPDVDVAVINGNYAIEGGLKVKDALAVEANDGLAAKTYGNIITTSPAKKDDPSLKALVEVLQSAEISKYINDTYEGAVVPLQ